ncbi:2-phospho-L-lactate guanylyltransferase [Halobacteriales archaeon QS_5_70_17]|nr:MAG: 2-phospho-L-lactate guanylyltransferase [Halobacteriales archaeon QS_5_70_17]
MRAVVPYCVEEPKTRLSPLLDADERASFARTMLADVLAAVEGAGGRPEVLATAPVDVGVDRPVVVDDRPLSAAVNAALEERSVGEAPVAVVMADLALATPDALAGLFGAEGDVVLAPGRGGGTNALVCRHPEFRVDYHGVSYRDHREVCAAVGADAAVVDSYRLGTDVDDPADLAEVLLHADGRAADWLRERGFAVAADGGRVRVRRE